MRLIILFFIILSLILSLIFAKLYKVKETYFKEQFDVNTPLLNEKYLIFNNNYNAKFLTEVKAFNNENVNDLKYYKNEIVPKEINNNLSSSFIKYIILIYNNTNYITDNNTFDNSLNNFGLLNKVNKNIIDKLNEKTYVNNNIFNPNKDFNIKYIDSDINEINIINNYFLETFNKTYFKYFQKFYKDYEFIKNKFLINKYKIFNMYKFNNIYFFELIVELIKNNGLMITQLFLTTYINNGKIFLKPIVLIGFGTLDELLLKNRNTNFNYYNILNSHNDDGIINSKNIPKILNKRKFEVDKNINIKKNYSCFNNNLEEKNILKSSNKQECESNYNIYGIKKIHGIWDRPCISDNECIYYKSNKNYPNEYGKCLYNGYCENPINVKNKSYHIFDNATKPLCYNCNSKEWKINTDLNDCCDEQKKKDKYPFLKGPDYAFKNDLIKRFNHKIYNKSYIKYKNIFDKTDFDIFKK